MKMKGSNRKGGPPFSYIEEEGAIKEIDAL